MSDQNEFDNIIRMTEDAPVLQEMEVKSEYLRLVTGGGVASTEEILDQDHEEARMSSLLYLKHISAWHDDCQNAPDVDDHFIVPERSVCSLLVGLLMRESTDETVIKVLEMLVADEKSTEVSRGIFKAVIEQVKNTPKDERL